MEIKTDEITSLLKQQLDAFKVDIDVSEVGEVTNVEFAVQLLQTFLL